MKLVQFYLPGKGLRAGVVKDDVVKDITSAEESLKSTLGIILRSVEENTSVDLVVLKALARGSNTYSYDALNVLPDDSLPHLKVPVNAPEVWGFGVTYKRSAVERDKDTGERGIYDYVYYAERPELFFKGTLSRLVGPNDSICIRRDSELTAVEPELGYVLGANGKIIGYTCSNDVSAWDIERENPLYLPQSKIFYGCIALGPVLVTTSEVENPYNLDITCRIIRTGETIFSGKVNSSQIKRPFEELTEFLIRDNPIPIGTAVSTGTGIMVPNELCLRDGDRVDIEIEGIGILSNPVRKLGR